MKTTRKSMNIENPYRIIGRLTTENINIQAFFKGGLKYEGPLSGLKYWAKENGANQPTGPCKCEDGTLRHLYPVIIAITPDVKQVLSDWFSTELTEGDGRSFGSRNHLIETAKLMKERGVMPPAEAFDWALEATGVPIPSGKDFQTKLELDDTPPW